MKPPSEWPDSPRKLLEARYQAYVDGDIDFILESTHSSVRSRHDRKAIAAWAKRATWMGLNVEAETEEEKRGWVTFTVRYEQDGQVLDQREKAEFRQKDGRWYYFDSTHPKAQPIVRDAAKVGRNDPCPCGSGKKYKKCCGAG